MSFDLTKEEPIRWNRNREWVNDNVTVPLNILSDYVIRNKSKCYLSFFEAKRKVSRLLGKAMLSRDDKW